jgi:hypothetical protein
MKMDLQNGYLVEIIVDVVEIIQKVVEIIYNLVEKIKNPPISCVARGK